MFMWSSGFIVQSIIRTGDTQARSGDREDPTEVRNSDCSENQIGSIRSIVVSRLPLCRMYKYLAINHLGLDP